MTCCKNIPHNSIQLTRGDDSNSLGHYIRITITTQLDVTGWYAIFQIANFQWRYNDLTSGELYVIVPRDITTQMGAGGTTAAVKIFDADDKCRTVLRDIPVFVNEMVVNNPTGE